MVEEELETRNKPRDIDVRRIVLSNKKRVDYNELENQKASNLIQLLKNHIL